MTHNRADGVEPLLLKVEVTGEVEGEGTRFARSENHALEPRTQRAVRKPRDCPRRSQNIELDFPLKIL